MIHGVVISTFVCLIIAPSNQEPNKTAKNAVIACVLQWYKRLIDKGMIKPIMISFWDCYRMYPECLQTQEFFKSWPQSRGVIVSIDWSKTGSFISMGKTWYKHEYLIE